MSNLDGRGRLLALAVLVSVFMAGALSATAVIQVLRTADGPEPGAMFQGPRPGMGSGRGAPGFTPGARGSRVGPPPGAPVAMSRELAERLDLTAEQRDSVRIILERRQEVSDSVMGRIFPTLRAQLDSTRLEIRDLLTEDQRSRFDELVRNGRERLFRRLSGEPPRGRP